MAEEREEKLNKLEKVNRLLNPQNFVKLKKELEIKGYYLKLLDIPNLEEEISETVIELQKIFLMAYQTKIKTVNTKQELMKLIYEFRYYCLLPVNDRKTIMEIEEIEDKIEQVQRLLIEKAHEIKLIDIFSKEKRIDYQILKNIFYVRVINLEDLYIKLIKEKDGFYIQLFDDNVFEEKIGIGSMEEINKKDLLLNGNRKVKIFN